MENAVLLLRGDQKVLVTACLLLLKTLTSACKQHVQQHLAAIVGSFVVVVSFVGLFVAAVVGVGVLFGRFFIVIIIIIGLVYYYYHFYY